MSKLYLVKHIYHVDGGFGDAIPEESIITAYTNKEDAEKFVEKWNNPQIYDRPYGDLWHHELEIEELEIDSHPIDQEPYAGWTKEEEECNKLYEKETLEALAID